MDAGIVGWCHPSSIDLAGRMSSRDYRTLANSPDGAISDTDTFTYDSASRMLTAESGRYTNTCLLYTSPSPRDLSTSRMPSSA